MSKLKWLAIGMCLLMSSSAWGQRMAHDSSFRASDYTTYGWRFGEAMKHTVDRSAIPESLVQHVLDNAGTTRNQLQRKVIVTPLTSITAGIDTTVDQMLTVPSGQTITIEEINLSANVELSEATDSLHLQIVRYLGTAKATMDTIVAAIVVDDDSANVYADTIFTLTLVDSVLTAGDILYAQLIAPGGAISAGEAVALTTKYRLDE